MLHLEIAKAVLVHCNIVNNDYQNDSRVLYIFITNKLLGKLLDISAKNPLFKDIYVRVFIVWSIAN